MWRAWGLILVGGLVYAASLSTPFVFDDLKWIRHDKIGTLWPISSAFGASSRPILNFSLALNYAVGRLDPFGYHLFNVFVHICASLALYGVARRTFRTHVLSDRYARRADDLAFSAALIWLVHPLATQAVTYVIQRGESMASLFYLLVLYCVIRCAQSERRALWTITAISCCAFGMGTKEMMVSAPLVAKKLARLVVIVVLPTPPLAFMTTVVCITKSPDRYVTNTQPASVRFYMTHVTRRQF